MKQVLNESKKQNNFSHEVLLSTERISIGVYYSLQTIAQIIYAFLKIVFIFRVNKEIKVFCIVLVIFFSFKNNL